MLVTVGACSSLYRWIEGHPNKMRNIQNRLNCMSVFRTGMKEKFILMLSLRNVILLLIQLRSNFQVLSIYIEYMLDMVNTMKQYNNYTYLAPRP